MFICRPFQPSHDARTTLYGRCYDVKRLNWRRVPTGFPDFNLNVLINQFLIINMCSCEGTIKNFLVNSSNVMTKKKYWLYNRNKFVHRKTVYEEEIIGVDLLKSTKCQIIIWKELRELREREGREIYLICNTTVRFVKLQKEKGS